MSLLLILKENYYKISHNECAKDNFFGTEFPKERNRVTMEKIKEKINIPKLINIIIIIGIIVRIIYISYTNYDVRQHDIEPEVGHIAYIMRIYENWSLPESNRWQFYHPPLHHFLSAVWLKTCSLSFFDSTQIMECLQVLPLIYTILMIFVTRKILKEINLEEKYQILVMTIISFHPSLILLSGSMNNDCLTLLLMVCVIWYMLKWRKRLLSYFNADNIKENKSGWKKLITTTIVFAIFMGLCVMTKLNGAIIAIPVAIFFIWYFFEYFADKEKIKRYIMILGIFGIISLSLGLWYPIRNCIKFGQDLTYVPTPGAASKCEGYSLAERFLPISKQELIDDVFCNTGTDCNIPAFVIKSSLFGEYSYYNVRVATFIKYINMIMILFVIISTIRNLINLKKKELRYERIFILLVQLISVASFIYFNIKMPYGCTMDFRYITITLFSGSILMAFDLKDAEGKKYGVLYRNVMYVFTVVFSILSIMLYTIK